MNRFPIFCTVALACIGTAGALSLTPLLHVQPELKPEVTANGKRLSKMQAPHGKPDKIQRIRPNDAITPPPMGIAAPDGDTYFCGFDTQEEFDAFTVINANGSPQQWTLSVEGYAFVLYNTSLPMDDWLISPAIHLEAGQRYVVSVDCKASSTNFPERIALYMGQGTTVADATYTLVEPTVITNTLFSGYGDYFTPEETGDYHIMLHGCSDADMSTLTVDNFRISSPGAVPLPGEDDITYKEVVLIDEDFSGVGGSEDNPIALEGDGHYLQGLEGWRGMDAYGIGGAVLIKGLNGTSGWAQLAPPKAAFTQETSGAYMARVEVEAKVVNLAPNAKDYYGNPYEGIGGTGMVGSTECPDGWCWGGNGADFNLWINSLDEWKSFSSDIQVKGSGSLLDDDFDVENSTELGEYKYNNYSVRMCPLMGSDVAIRKYRLIELVPEVPTIPTWEITEYSADGFSIGWEPIEGADRYVVDLYDGDLGGYTMTRLERKVVTEPTASFDIQTSDGRGIFVNMFACMGDKRSPLSPTRRVFSVNAPSFGPLAEPVNGKMEVPFTCDPATHDLEIHALAGKEAPEAISDFEIARISFADFPDSEAGENTPYTRSLHDQASGWIMYPAASFEGGAFKCNNTNAFWGYVDFMTVAGHSAYDFSDVKGKIKVKVTARTDGKCMMTVNLNTFDRVERYFKPYSSDAKSLTNEYQTYEFELDPQGRENVYINVTTGGSDTNYIKDVTVTCDLEAGQTMLLPFMSGAIELKDKNISSGKFELEVPSGSSRIRVTGQSYRGLLDSDGKLYYNARSLFSKAAEYPEREEPNSLENPLPMPYYEGFDNAAYTQPAWEVIPISGEIPTIRPVNEGPFTGLFPYGTRDKGFLEVENDKAGEFYFVSPYIYIDDNQAQAMIHWAYFRSSDVTVEGMIQYDGGEWVSEECLNDWGSDDMNPAWTSVSTAGWPAWGEQAGKVFRFGWKITTNGEGGAFSIDNIGFGVLPVYDFGLVLPHVTPVAKPGQDINVSVEVGVFGQLTSKKFNVTAKLDGETIGNCGHPDSNPWGEKRTKCEFPVTLPEDISIGEHNVTFELEFEGDYAGSTDEDLSNNAATVTFTVVGEYLPGATGLTNNGGTLTWTVPANGERFTDDIEGLESFADGNLDVVYKQHPIYDYDVLAKTYGNRGSIGAYTVIDGDGKPTNSDDNWVAQNIPNVFHLMSCTVADFQVETDGFGAASGNKALLFWSNADGTPCDNWLVLPELNDADRVLSFMARAYDNDNPEKIEILTSATDDNTESFTLCRSFDIESEEYSLVECQLPADARYVAIRQISDEGYGLVVDNISYSIKPRTVVGYNVYLNGQKVNDTPLAAPTFNASEAGSYSVSVVYPEGESARTAELDVTPGSINGIVEDNETEAIYYNLQGIRVANPGDGIYIKVQGGKTTKVIR